MPSTKFLYTTKKGFRLAYYAFFPKSVPQSCIICIHGGGWQSDSAERLFKQAEYFAENGAVGISIDYRLNGADTDVRDGLYDCVCALTAIREMLLKKYGKVLKIIALGDSAGGYYAVCLGNQKVLSLADKSAKIVDYVVDLNGIVDLMGKWSYGIRDKGAAKSYSPLYNVSHGDSPVLIMHGDEDKTVDIADALAYEKALKEKGVECETKILRGAAHAFILFNYRHDNEFVAKTLQDIMQYFKEKDLI